MWLCTALCLWLPAGCGNLYTGEGMEPPIVNPDDPDNPNPTPPEKIEEVPIMVSYTDPSYNSFTKGLGAFDEGTEQGRQVWEKAVFYIYAFRSDDPLLDFAVTRSQDKETCLVDGSTETPADARMGRRARLNRDEASAFFTWLDNEPLYYSSLYQTRPFNFFAYYIDDIEPQEFKRDTESIRFRFTLDGTQDILCAAARFTDQQLEQADNLSNVNERDNVLNYRYSSYTGHRNFQPVFTFRHYLSRLNFEAYPGGRDATNIYIQSVKVKSQATGIMTVAAKDTTQVGVTFDGTPVDFVLKEADGTPLLRDTYHVEMTPEDLAIADVYQRSKVRLGSGSLLSVPADTYELTIELKQVFTDGRPEATYLTKYPLHPTGGFRPGAEYTLRIAVYGLELIKVDAIITGWANGGQVDVDPDKEFN